MGIPTLILVGTIALAALSLIAYLAHAAIDGENRAGTAATAEAEMHGQVLAANEQTKAANQATAELAAARDRQQARADALEQELHDLEANPILMADPGHPGRAQLRAALSTVAADRPRAAGNPGGVAAGPGGVPDAAPAAGTAPAGGSSNRG